MTAKSNHLRKYDKVELQFLINSSSLVALFRKKTIVINIELTKVLFIKI